MALAVVEYLTGVWRELAGTFVGAEESRLWWVWVFVTFPLGAALVRWRELRRSGEPVTPGRLLAFAYPASAYTSRSFRLDVWVFVSVATMWVAVVTVVPGLGVASLTQGTISLVDAQLLAVVFPGALRDAVSPSLALHLLFSFFVILAYDFGFTVLHLLFHRIPWLWRFHRVHHAATSLTPLTAYRFHFVEHACQKVSEGVCVGAVCAVFYYFSPVNLDMVTVFGLSAFGLAFSSVGVFRHSHIWISYGYLSYVFVSPAMHQIHHSTEPRHRDRNLAQVFSFWDLLFGTLYVPREREHFQVGLAAGDRGDGGTRPTGNG